MGFLPRLNSHMKWKKTADCHFWMFTLLANRITQSPLLFTNPHTHTQIVTCNSLHTTHDNTSFWLLEVYTTGSRPTLQIILNMLHSPVRFNRRSHSTDILENILVHNNRSPIGPPQNPPRNPSPHYPTSKVCPIRFDMFLTKLKSK